MDGVGLDDWKRWRAAGCNRLPAAAVLADEPLPASWLGFADAPVAVLLESGLVGRYSFLCDRPAELILGRDDGIERWSPDGAERLESIPGLPLDLLADRFAGVRVPKLRGWPAMTGGLIGAFGYDLVQTWERLPQRAQRDLPLPLFAAIETAELFVYDHAERRLGAVVWREIGPDNADDAALAATFREATLVAERALERWREAVRPSAPVVDAPVRAAGNPAAEIPVPSFPAGGFEDAVRRILDYIAAGDTYQVNLSLRTTRPADATPAEIYEALRRVNPSPYMGLFRLPAWSLVCGSPELLVRLVDGAIVSRPIAGTRPRGARPDEDVHLSAELLTNEKERAEHLMLVDLIRNDIGRVAAFGSVRVSEFMALERYSHVMHIVSEVEGRLAAGADWAAVFRAMFPGGTITGCPKVRTMEIIEELEPVGRGFYTGALGWIGFGGDMEMNIVIRSLLVRDGVAHVQAGAGIVADSRPERELDESRRKAQAPWVALDRAQARRHG